jgi:sensor domain CHASE-containing protein
MQIDGEILLTAAPPIIGAIVWFVRLEGRVNTQSELHQQLRADVTYIRSRIDEALNGKA